MVDPAGHGDFLTNVRSIEYGENRWIDIREPTAANVAELEAEFGFHPLLLEDISANRVQRPKIDDYDDYILIVMNFPVHDKESRKNLAAEVDMIIGENFFITVHDGQLKPLVKMIDSLFESPDLGVRLLQRSPGHLLYEVVDRLVDYCIPIVPKIEERIEGIEERIFESRVLETAQEISVVRRDLISLRRILKPQLGIIRQLERGNIRFVGDDIDDYWGDIADHLARIWDSLEDFKDILEGLSDTHNTLISQRTNEIIRVLTIISVVMLPLTVITGVFGMNVPIPFQESSLALAGIIGILMTVIISMLLVFHSRRWV
jgi:magnesium transporter